MSLSPVAPQSAPPVVAPVTLADLRRDFPSLSVNEVYLDSAASSLTPRAVVEAMNGYYYGYRANVNRGAYRSSSRATDAYEAACGTIAGFIGATADDLVITMNATHALNLVALSVEFQAGDEIIVPTLEHASNMMPWVRAAKTSGARIQWWNPDRLGFLQLRDLEGLITPKTKVISMAQISNVLGTEAPVREVAKLCRERGILFCVDACQSVPHLRIDVTDLDCDFLVLSAHKMLGPVGVGGLYVRKEIQDKVAPAIIGSESVPASACPGMSACAAGQMPHPKWVVAGTPPIAETIGWARAVEYLEAIGMESVVEHDRLLVDRALAGLVKIPGLTLFGPASSEKRSSIVSFSLGDLAHEEVGRMLSENFNVAVRAGTHCARGYFMENQPDSDAYGNVRASFYVYNTEQEVDRLVEGVDEIARTCL